jgi:hypothetical protein
VIGFIGSFHLWEGSDDLVAAMPALVAARPAATLLLIGGGSAEEALRAGCDRADGEPHEEVECYYGLVDILVYPGQADMPRDPPTPDPRSAVRYAASPPIPPPAARRGSSGGNASRGDRPRADVSRRIPARSILPEPVRSETACRTKPV